MPEDTTGGAASRSADRGEGLVDERFAVLAAVDGPAGYLLRRREPSQSVSEAEDRFLRLSSSLGRNVSRDAVGAAVSRAVISASADPSFRGRYVGDAHSSLGIPLHTDASGESERRVDLLAMFVARQAPTGGETVLCDPFPVVARLDERARALLREPWPRRHPFAAEGSTAYVWKPIVGRDERVPVFSYGFQRLRLGLEAIADRSLRAERQELLERLNAALEAATFDLRLEDGDFLVLDNRRLLHGRRGFCDASAAPRRLLRVWIERLPEGAAPRAPDAER